MTDAQVHADTVLMGGTVVTVDDADRVVDDGAIAIKDGRIIAIGTRRDAESWQADEQIDTTDTLLIPGLVNTHTHLGMTLFRGYVDDLTLEDFLGKVVPREREVLSADHVYAGTALGAIEAALAGTTTVLDMYFFDEAGAAAVRDVGLRGFNGPTFLDEPGPDGRTFDEVMRVTRDRLESQPAGAPPLFLAPHATYTVQPDELVETAELAAEFGAALHIHAAESAAEVRNVLELHGRRPVELLAHLGVLDLAHTVVAHGVHLTDEERALLSASGSAVAHCPVSNAKLASGMADTVALQEAGVAVGLGTDGPATSNDLDLWTAMRFAGALPKLIHGDPTAMPARAVVRMATIDGARALGVGAVTGSLQVGKAADIVVVDLDAPHLRPLADPYSTLAYAAGRDDVRDVFVEGRRVVADRAIATVDVAPLIAEVRDISAH